MDCSPGCASLFFLSETTFGWDACRALGVSKLRNSVYPPIPYDSILLICDFLSDPLSPVAALWFMASVPSSCLAGVIACLDEDSFRPFVQKASGEQASD